MLAYVLVAGEGKDKDGQGSKEIGGQANVADFILRRELEIWVGEVVDHNKDQVEHSRQSKSTGGLEGVQTLQEGEGSNDAHEDSDPESTVFQEPPDRVHSA